MTVTDAPLSSVQRAAVRLTPEGKVLVLRTCNADLTSTRGFQWPESGPVEASDWDGKPSCGGGLHGLPWGVGGASYLSTAEDARWLVVAVDPADMVIVEGDKVKYRAGVVVLCATREEAVGHLVDQLVEPLPVNWATLTGGDGATLTGGYRATLTGGDGATLTGGDGATLTFKWWDSAKRRYRVKVRVVGEDGIEAGVAYRLNDDQTVSKVVA